MPTSGLDSALVEATMKNTDEISCPRPQWRVTVGLSFDRGLIEARNSAAEAAPLIEGARMVDRDVLDSEMPRFNEPVFWGMWCAWTLALLVISLLGR